VNRLTALITLGIPLAGLVLFGLGDNFTSVADTSVPDNEVTGKLTKE
jgi:hypothetical protein